MAGTTSFQRRHNLVKDAELKDRFLSVLGEIDEYSGSGQQLLPIRPQLLSYIHHIRQLNWRFLRVIEGTLKLSNFGTTESLWIVNRNCRPVKRSDEDSLPDTTFKQGLAANSDTGFLKTGRMERAEGRISNPADMRNEDNEDAFEEDVAGEDEQEREEDWVDE